MEIIEIGNACICAKISGDVPQDRASLLAVCGAVFSACGRQPFENPEIAAYSNGSVSLVFISRRARQSALGSFLHNFVI